MNSFISLKKHVLYRLLAAFCVAAVIVMAASVWLNISSFKKAALHKKNDTLRHFKKRLVHLNQDWEEEAMQTKSLVEITRYLEDRSARWEKLNAYFLAQSGVPKFSHIAVTDQEGSVLFRFGPDSDKIPAIIRMPEQTARDYMQILEGAYRIFRLPVWMGADGMAYLLLFKPLDNAYLVDLSYPNIDLYLTWKEQPLASSRGQEGITGFSSVKGKTEVNGLHYEQISIQLDEAGVKTGPAPTLVVRALVERPFSTSESVVLGFLMLAPLIGLIWLSTGAYFTATVRRIIALEEATKQFSEDRVITPSAEKILIAESGLHDELGGLGNSLLSMMKNIEEFDEKRRQHEEELEKSNEELERFAFIASHDLQEPLRKIASFAELLEKRYKGRLDENADRYIGYVIEGSNRMRSQIQDLLAYSRLDAHVSDFRDTDINSVLKECIEDLHVAILENGAIITNGPLPIVKADEALLRSVMLNLLTNAVKFKGGEQPRIHVSSEERGDEWVISVQDNGIGIEPDYFERVFGMFQRLHSKSEYSGTGIGLAICKKIVERHGGRIWVESEKGKGSTFYFAVPKQQGE